MATQIIVGPHTWRNIPGHVVVQITPFSPQDWDVFTSTTPKLKPASIQELKQKFGGLKGQLVHPINEQTFSLDLSPWSHLDDATLLYIEWLFMPEHPIPTTDPRHPKYYTGDEI